MKEVAGQQKSSKEKRQQRKAENSPQALSLAHRRGKGKLKT
jgi:hypothetical protein